MDKKLVILNSVYAFLDTATIITCFLTFCWGAWAFNKWWIMLLSIFYVAGFQPHSLVRTADEKDGDTHSES